MDGRTELLEVLRQAKALISCPGNDFVRAWPWHDLDVAIREIDFKISLIETQPEPDTHVVGDLFVPTGVLQELSLANGWSGEFMKLAEDFESVAQRIWRSRNPHLVREFDPSGGPIPLDKLRVYYTPEYGTDPRKEPGG
jgi:hypothetical protein